MDKYVIAKIKGETEENVETETILHNISKPELAACVISLAEDLCDNYNDLQHLLNGIEQMVTLKLVINGTNKIMENIKSYETS